MPKYKLDKGSIQYEFNRSRKKIQMFGGGFGNGKTAAVCIKAIQLAFDYPGSNGLIARETYVKLNDTIRKEFYKWIPHGSVARWPTVNDNTMVLTNGSVINFRYISQRGKKTSDGNTTSNLLSATYDWIVVDQIEDPQIQYKDFLDLLGRLRGSTPYKGDDPTMPMTGPRFLMITANPSGNWVYKKLVKPVHVFNATGRVMDDLIVDADTLEPQIVLYEGPTHGNAKNLEPDFIKSMEAAYKGQMKERYLMGKWAAYEGLVYPEFSIDSHVLEASWIEDNLNSVFYDRQKFRAVQGFDFGITSPSCYGLGYVDELGRIVFVDGFYLPNLTTDKIAKMIKELQKKWEWALDFTDPLFCDPAIFKKTQVKGQTVTTVAKLLQAEDLYIKAGQNDIKNGIMKVTGYLNILPQWHIKDMNMPGPSMYFSDHLEFFQDEFAAYFWKTNELGERIDEPNDRNDHAMDMTKYAVSIIPDATTLLYRRPIITPEHLKWHEVN